MADEEHYTDIDISDVVDNSEQIEHYADYVDSELPITEGIETETVNTIEDSELLSEGLVPVEKRQHSARSDLIRTTRLPMARIKNIMKMDPDVNLVNSEAVFLVTKATELFLETIAKETYTHTASKKRRTIAKKDLDTTISIVDCLCFLEGALDF